MQQIADTVVGPIEYRREDTEQPAVAENGSVPVVLVLNGGHTSRHSRYGHENSTGHGYRVLTPSRPGLGMDSELDSFTEKLAEGIRGFAADQRQLETLLAERIESQ